MTESKVVAIMQPTFLPWSGYFYLMASAHEFVFLDDVQFAKPSWQMRNRILCRGAAYFVTVPTSGGRHQLLKDVRIADEPFRPKLCRLLEHTYGKHPFGGPLLELVVPILMNTELERLEQLNLGLIDALASALCISPKTHLARELAVPGKRSDHLVNIARELGATRYLSPPGSANYLAEDGAFEAAAIPVEFSCYEARPYPQRGTNEFVPQLSVIDVIAHLGFEEARRYVTEAPTPPRQAAPNDPHCLQRTAPSSAPSSAA